SYIAQLGNDPPASFEEQCALVAACLDAGMRLLDTTYYQERIALGRVLQHLGRRDEAMVTGWNFFKQPGKEDELVAWTPYAPGHIDVMLQELQTNRIDLLVIHAEDDPGTLHRELALAEAWVATGKIRQVGLGMARLQHLDQLPAHHSITHVLAPYNAFNRAAAALFVRARALGMRTIAMSPFIRGWKLQEIGEDPAEVAAILLRWVVSQPVVDHVIVAMRKREWVQANLEAAARGALTPQEELRLAAWATRAS
ncbi:MAG: aldo/keto reductase, partial [Chloroflexota bacterium]|nr:aldo/keto reductase [Chloroflexota bacterium]